jgi:hypothetical protein
MLWVDYTNDIIYELIYQDDDFWKEFWKWMIF